ncbi:MAG: cellulase family glycosylhydrolase [Ruminococcus sp.]|nr:cellulase family glycosylhydrolase [Ruminococcus sp.]MBQ8297252.1 cellulase family glycosylhydrolase [Ruminococcus sp.]
MKKRISAFLMAAAMALSFAGCSNDSDSKESSSSEASVSETDAPEDETAEASTEPETEAPTPEPTTVHISPVETVTASVGTQITLDKTILREDGSNTVSIPLSEFISDGDDISSFTFVIYSDNGGNIGTFKGGCGISVTENCPSATDEGWYQSADFSAQTEGAYGEITWQVPAEIRDYISAGGEVLFGYWWGGTTSIRVAEVICTYTSTKEIPVDGTASLDVKQSVGFNDTDNIIEIPAADLVPEGNVPQAVTFNVSTTGSFGKFTGAFGYSLGENYYMSPDSAVFTDSSSLSLTWFVPENVKSYAGSDGDILLGYWWSDQPTLTLDSVSVKYSYAGGTTGTSSTSGNDSDKAEKVTMPADTSQPSNSSADGSFRSASELVSAIKVGWNLGNTLECYDYSDYTSDGETAWGNPKTTQAMIDSVKSAGFNAIRIPVTWGEHMNGNTIDSAWMNRVQEVVDYAYDQDMFVILNMHHDDYVWFTPNEGEYAADSAKLCAIWTQISERFKDYGDRLLFEGMNEPRTIGSSNEWMGGTPEERAVINKYEQDFVNTVRSSGGNNAERTLIITSYAASIEDSAINDVVVPNDKNIIVSIHAYAPWSFANGETSQWSQSDLDANFSKLKSTFIDKGTPVLLTEFGAVSDNDSSIRAPYFEYYVSAAKSYGIKCFVWDNNVESGESSFGIFDRETLTWNNTLLQGIMNGAN